MNEHIIKQLKQLKTIAPDAAFVSRSRELILNALPARKNRFAVIFAWSGAAALMVLIAGFSYIVSAPTMALSSSLNETKINDEINSLSTGIEVQQITYEQKVNQTVASALHEVGETKANHINTSLLTKEAGEINKGSDIYTSEEVDALLDRATQ
jgi:hypothetical protein